MSITRYNSINGLQPYLRDRVKRIMKNMRRKGYDPILFETYRSPERQLYLYGKGRTIKQMLKFWRNVSYSQAKKYTNPKAKIVTYTPLATYHGVGKAADIISKKRLWNWPAFFDALKFEAAKEGMKTLIFERCHIQWGG